MELTHLLERMKMEHLLAQLDGVCEQAAKGDVDYKGFLTQALEAEWRGRHQRGVESRLKLARFPWLKSLEQFDFDFQPSIDRKMLRELAGLSFVERADNVVLLQYLPQDASIRRALTVLKTRASGHQPAVREYTIGHEGITLEPLAAAPTV